MIPMNNTNILFVHNEEGARMGVCAPITFTRGPLNPGLGKAVPTYKVDDRLDVDIYFVPMRANESYPAWASRAAMEVLADCSPVWASDINAATALGFEELEMIDFDALEYANQGDRSQPVGWSALMGDLE